MQYWWGNSSYFLVFPCMFALIASRPTSANNYKLGGVENRQCLHYSAQAPHAPFPSHMSNLSISSSSLPSQPS